MSAFSVRVSENFPRSKNRVGIYFAKHAVRFFFFFKFGKAIVLGSRTGGNTVLFRMARRIFDIGLTIEAPLGMNFERK